MGYLYKGIHVFQTWGTWQADYVMENGTRFALHRACLPTKAKAYELAKMEVNALNGKE